jgi:hypothetical protein
MRYEHTQRAPLYLILAAIGLAMIASAWFVPEWTVRGILLGTAALVLLLAASFASLTVRGERDELLVRFGPLPIFRRRVLYSDIDSVEQTRSSLLDGWGIHLSPSGGWTWNLWGFDCVDVRFRNGGKLRIGTDDPMALEAFLKERVARGAAVPSTESRP